VLSLHLKQYVKMVHHKFHAVVITANGLFKLRIQVMVVVMPTYRILPRVVPPLMFSHRYSSWRKLEIASADVLTALTN
jgi:hypothetical protein